MIKQVNPKTVLSIGNRQFVLLYDDSFEGKSACFNCALKDLVCKEERPYSLAHLCDDLQSEPNTFFVEIKP